MGKWGKAKAASHSRPAALRRFGAVLLVSPVMPWAWASRGRLLRPLLVTGGVSARGLRPDGSRRGLCLVASRTTGGRFFRWDVKWAVALGVGVCRCCIVGASSRVQDQQSATTANPRANAMRRHVVPPGVRSPRGPQSFGGADSRLSQAKTNRGRRCRQEALASWRREFASSPSWSCGIQVGSAALV